MPELETDTEDGELLQVVTMLIITASFISPVLSG
jgi:hypothetical protein